MSKSVELAIQEIIDMQKTEAKLAIEDVMDILDSMIRAKAERKEKK